MANVKTKIQPEKPQYLLSNAIVNYFLLVMFAIFPLFVNITLNGSFPFLHFEDGFGGIRHQKYYFFVTMAALAVIAEILLIFTEITGEKKSSSSRKSLLDSITFVDWAVIALVLSCAISTVFSPHIELAFWGEVKIGASSTGRNNGLFLILLYSFVYFMITRLYKYKEYVFTALAISCGVVYLLTVLNGYYIDPLNMFEKYRVSQPNVYMEFFSTIGNKNMLASFICVTLPVIFVMSILTKTLWCRIAYLCATGLGAMAVIIDDSDSAMLGLAVFLAVFLVVFARDISRLKRYFLALTITLGSVKILRLFSLIMNDNYKELGDIPKGILFSGAVYVLIIISAAITALLWLLDSKKPNLRLPKAVPIALGSVFGAVVVAALGVFIYFSVIDTETKLGSMEKLLRMNDAWGTHRGIMWLRSFKIFGEASFFQKLFGTGPDTFYFAFEPYFNELKKFGNTSTDAAHNEYINYLITIGIAGLAAYLAFVGSALVRAFKAAKKQPIVLAAAAAVICYAAQAVVNIAVPISAPLFIIFVSLCEAFARQEKEIE